MREALNEERAITQAYLLDPVRWLLWKRYTERIREIDELLGHERPIYVRY